MVVVALISILAIVAMPALKTPVDVDTTARGVASLIGEAARTAVVHGVVPPAVATDAGENARTKIEIRTTAVPHRIHIWIQTGTATSTCVSCRMPFTRSCASSRSDRCSPSGHWCSYFIRCTRCRSGS